VSGLSSSFNSDLVSLITAAKQHNVVVLICLWSFDMCKTETSNSMHIDLISNADHTKSYITKALVPMLQAVKSYNNIAWEIINEPEWCVKETPGTTPQMVPLVEMQRFTGMIAEAIHQNSPQKVTTGSACLKWNSDKSPAVGNWWSDSALQKAYPSSTGHLDFYQIHYYDWMYNPDWGFDPCRVPSSFWNLDKPTLVGELSATSAHYSPMDELNCSFNGSFIGDMWWAYNANADWTSAIPATNQFYSAHSNLASYNALVAWVKR